MRFARFFSLLIFVLAIFRTPVWAQVQPRDWPGDDTAIYLAHDVDHHFYEARVYLLEKKREASADEIRRAAALVELQAYQSEGAPEKDLMDSYHQLRKLADDIQADTITSAKTLDLVFARANHALAENHYLRAVGSWQRKDAGRTGQELKAAAIHLERAVVWAGYKGEEFIKGVIKDATVIAEKLIKGSGWAAEEVGTLMKALGKAIEQVGKAIEPSK